MKLFRYGQPGQEKPGLLWNNAHCSVAHVVTDYNEAFFEAGGLQTLAHWLQQNGSSLTPLEAGFRFGPCVARPSKIVCIGLNYEDHARETGAAIPAEPVIFMKSTTAIIGPNDTVMLPKGSVKSDWEVELAVIMGQTARYVAEDEALNYVAAIACTTTLANANFSLSAAALGIKVRAAILLPLLALT